MSYSTVYLMSVDADVIFDDTDDASGEADIASHAADGARGNR